MLPRARRRNPRRGAGRAVAVAGTDRRCPMTTAEHFGTGSKKGRGMAQQSLDLIEAMYAAAEAAQPITGRGVGYKLFTRGLIPSMATGGHAEGLPPAADAREQGDIPWEWIVDETRALERVSTWDDPADYAACVARSYRRDFWNQQPVRVEVWSEKGTVRGVLAPVLDRVRGRLPCDARIQQRDHDLRRCAGWRRPRTDRALCRRLRSERHVHVGSRLAGRGSPTTAAITSR